MKRLVVFLAFVAGSATLLDAGGQSLESRLKQLFPAATSFSPKEGDPPHFTAYSGAPNSQTVAGFAFWTTELEPLERGYDGPIKMLVGMDTKGVLTGVLVVDGGVTGEPVVGEVVVGEVAGGELPAGAPSAVGSRIGTDSIDPPPAGGAEAPAAGPWPVCAATCGASASGSLVRSFFAISCSGNCTRNFAAASRIAALVARTIGPVLVMPLPEALLPYPVNVSESASTPFAAYTLRR